MIAHASNLFTSKAKLTFWLLVFFVSAFHLGVLTFLATGVRSLSQPKLDKKSTLIYAYPSSAALDKVSTDSVQVTKKLKPIADLSKPRPKEMDVKNSLASTSKPTIFASSETVYFLREELDNSAEPLADIGKELSKILPVLSGTVIIEFWITETGQVTRIDFIKGETLLPLDEAMQILLNYEFAPAMRAGKSVASRKLIEVDTDAVLQSVF